MRRYWYWFRRDSKDGNGPRVTYSKADTPNYTITDAGAVRTVTLDRRELKALYMAIGKCLFATGRK